MSSATVLFHEFTLRPIYADTDAEGVVYYARYLEWMERGRTEWIRQLGCTVADLKNDGVITAVRRAEIDYHAPARYDELILVKTSVTELKGAKMFFEQTVLNQSMGQLLVSGKILLVALDIKTFKPTRMPERLTKEFVEIFEEITDKHAMKAVEEGRVAIRRGIKGIPVSSSFRKIRSLK